MPIKSEQQRRFMAMCLHSPEKAKDKCPPKSVAKKFIHGHKKQEENSMDLNYRNGVKALFEAVVEAKRGTARFAGAGTSTDTGGADLHRVTQQAANRVVPKNVTRFEGDPTSPAAAKAQKKANTAQDAMDAALNPSEDEGAPPKNLPAPTNRRGNMKPETPGGKATNPYDRPIAGKLTVNKVAKAIAQMRGKK